jgi:Neisseria PilC beta-propeller domain
MKHRRASGFLLAAIVGAAASLSDMPTALSQIVTPSCEQTATPTAFTGAALGAAAPIRIGVNFTGSALVLSSAAPGKVISLPLNLTPLGMASTQMVITGARLRTVIAGNVRFFMSASDSPEWVEALRCDNIPTSQEFCVRFPKPAGRSLRWMALMDTSAGAPSIQSVQPIFDYLADNEHYRGGIALHEGIAYFGGFAQPGDLGQLYASSLDFGTVHWRARERLASSTRKIFTANAAQRIPFETGYEADLVPVLGRTAPEVTAVVNWVRNTARFGLTGPERRFGGIISSTPVVVGKPELPVWYFRASPARRGQFLDFRRDRALRPPLVLYGAKDGMVHALHTDPRNVTDTDMGKEAWAFIPSGIAGRMANDFDSNLISAYPDTWAVYDHVLLGGDFATIAVLAHGRGGTGISTIDINNTVTGDAVSGYTVTGPQPLWEQIPQVLPAFEPGLALSRPAIARVSASAGGERYMVIAGTGISYNDPDRINTNGRIVMAYDAETGNPYWKFQTRCPLTTAISVFETNDQGEPEPVPELDGFMDRAVFADRCGYVYKVDLTAELAGGWTPGLGAIPTDLVDGVQMSALFRTDLGRPVTGNIAVRAVVDADTTRVALFFGTGGLEEEPPFRQNTFYALAASPDDPADTDPQALVFQRILGSCPTATNCEKFYGGVRVNPQQVFFTRVLEPPLGVGAAACDAEPGRTIIEARSLVGDISTAIDQQLFEVTVDAVMTGPLAGSGGGFAGVNQEGDVITVGNLGAGSAGTGADQATMGGGRAADDKRNAPMLILGWRQVY